MKLCGYLLALLPVLFGCNGNGPYTPNVDPRSQSLIHKTWRLYSNDIVDTSNGQVKYISRNLADSCMEWITFQNPNVLTQIDSCNGQNSVLHTATWTWYDRPSILIAEIYTGNQDQTAKTGFQYSEDTLQFDIVPGEAIDSTYTRFYLRIRTYVNQ